MKPKTSARLEELAWTLVLLGFFGLILLMIRALA